VAHIGLEDSHTDGRARRGARPRGPQRSGGSRGWRRPGRRRACIRDRVAHGRSTQREGISSPGKHIESWNPRQTRRADRQERVAGFQGFLFSSSAVAGRGRGRSDAAAITRYTKAKSVDRCYSAVSVQSVCRICWAVGVRIQHLGRPSANSLARTARTAPATGENAQKASCCWP
jgi:hypothetical protein